MFVETLNVLVDLPCVCVVVNFLSHVIFVFLLFLGMVMSSNEVETKETKITFRLKFNYKICKSTSLCVILRITNKVLQSSHSDPNFRAIL